jgi:long-chain acyl-CoA synthetase
MAFMLRDAGVAAMFVSSRQQLARVQSVRDQLPELRHIIVFDGVDDDGDVISLASFEARGDARRDATRDWTSEALRVSPDDLATVIYTSGTTGEPRGVMLTHGNIASNVAAALTTFELTSTDECLSFLPLCHIFERMAGYYCMLAAGAVINYATSVDSVAAELIEVRPTVLMSVPRLYEKIHDRVVERVRESGAISQRLFAWSRDVGDRRVAARLAQHPLSMADRLAWRVADALVFAKLRQRTGGRIRFCVSGGAPLNPDICRFFLAAGITLLEGYGLTETSPVIAVNTMSRLRPGTVGAPLPGVDVRIAADGEILARGPGIMRGYWHRAEDTAAAIDADGWFHTGDVGAIDDDGYLRITDRKKDLIKTSGGKYIAPQPIEAALRHNRFIASAVMLGDGRQFPIMLLVPDFDVLRTWMDGKGMPCTDANSAVQVAAVREKLEREARKSLRDLAQFEVPKKFLILARDFSIESGELTPTLKVKRRVVAERYRDEIAALYTGL